MKKGGSRKLKKKKKKEGFSYILKKISKLETWSEK